MRKKVKIGCMTIFMIVVLGLIILAGLNKHETSKRDCLYISATLSKMEKAELKEVSRLQSDFGNKVWPGLERERPIILFNDRYEFLLKASRPPEPWEVVEEDDFFGNPYYRRLADKPQAFAVAVGDQWAGSLGTRDQMNREYLLGARRQLPPFLAPFYPYTWATISWDVHVVLLFHEIFHAFQAEQFPLLFSRAMSVYALESAYPFDSVEFADAWDKESAFLSRALKAEDESDVRDSIRQFLKVRETRRIEASLKPELVAFENALEWLEGLAKYAEIRFYELAVLQKNGSKFTKYKTSLPPHWKMEFRRINGKLGRLEGDYRFYLSGMAQARLLDRVRPNWQMQFNHEDSNLEDILRVAVETGENY